MKNLADVIRNKIDETGLKRKAVAEMIGVEQQTLSAMLTGRRKIYAIDFIKLCKLLDLTMDDFTEEN